jgi:hypothetical protein
MTTTSFAQPESPEFYTQVRKGLGPQSELPTLSSFLRYRCVSCSGSERAQSTHVTTPSNQSSAPLISSCFCSRLRGIRWNSQASLLVSIAMRKGLEIHRKHERENEARASQNATSASEKLVTRFTPEILVSGISAKLTNCHQYQPNLTIQSPHTQAAAGLTGVLGKCAT